MTRAAAAAGPRLVTSAAAAGVSRAVDVDSAAGANIAALRPGWRALRVALLGSISLALGTAAHTLGGGSLPPAGVLVVAAIAFAMVAVALTGRQPRWWLLAAVLGMEQLVLHLFLTTAVTGCAPTSPGGHAVVAGPAHDMAVATCGRGAGGATTTDGHGAAMWAAHAVATLLTVWLLARGEAWLWRQAARAVVAAAAAPRALPERRRPAEVCALASPARSATSRSAAPRGPPALCA